MKILIRKIVLKVLKATAFDTKITHHFTKQKFLLNTYNHKGYWYYGAKRENHTLKIFQESIGKGDYVLEIGGHIGYFTTFFATLVGKDGKVDVFEPSEINLKYLTANINLQDPELQKVVSIVKKGAADVNGVLDFYIDPITGQNNSFVENFEGFFKNRDKSADDDSNLKKVSVEVITLDDYFQDRNNFPDFVKIDVEGFELNVVQGFQKTIEKALPILIIEIQRDAEKIINYFRKLGYTVYNDKMEKLNNHQDYLNKRTLNIFFQIERDEIP